MTHTFQYDILVIGSLNADLVVRSPRFPAPGETISGDDLLIIPGGKGANQAVAAARLGAQSAMVGRVGSDSFGPFLVNNLNSNQVNTAHVKVNDSATGTAIIVVDTNGQNSIVLSPGANGKVALEDVDSAPSAKALLLQFEIPMETVLYAAKRYKSQGATVILNPAPARPIPDGLLNHVDILVPNESELALLTGMPVTDASTADLAAREILKRGVEIVIVTLGSKGALIVNHALTKQVNTFNVDVVDTTAAGDAFIGGFASAMLNGTSLEDSVQYGCACGALATTKFGAQPSLPTRDEVEKFIHQRS
ncbi:MAG TPA: ribokinase [Anaerolineales bacterium]|nr:ribokinase [Anaerolineales bacterium]HNO31287.1 ribokinase [Anaerolineales bacterium]